MEKKLSLSQQIAQIGADLKFEDLPENCRKYVEFLEQQIGAPIHMVSNGPRREDIIYR